jgi:flagellar hook assembly protein FlgD
MSSVDVYNTTGRLVRRLVGAEGARSVVWDGTDARGRWLGAGVYLLKLAPAPDARYRVVLAR